MPMRARQAVGLRCSGQTDDAALNPAVQRCRPDAAARARFEADVNHAGRFRVRVLTTHGIHDATEFADPAAVGQPAAVVPRANPEQ